MRFTRSYRISTLQTAGVTKYGIDGGRTESREQGEVIECLEGACGYDAQGPLFGDSRDVGECRELSLVEEVEEMNGFDFGKRLGRYRG